MGSRLYFRARIGWGKRQPDAPHYDDIGEIVADVSNLLRGNICVSKDLEQDRDLLDVALINVAELALFGAFFSGR